MTPVLELAGITLARGTARVLEDVSLSVAEGEIVALAGPSGAGKSTLLRVLLGFDAPAAGTVRIRGQLATEARRILIPPEERKLAMVFQDLALWPHLTVREHVAFPLASRGALQEAKVSAALTQVGLVERAARYPGELSGGERQRVALARALAAEPDAVALDEPLSNLDIALKLELLGLLRVLLRSRRVAAIYVTHDPREAAALADRIIILDHGRVVQAGTADELRAEPATAFARIFVQEMPAGPAEHDRR